VILFINILAWAFLAYFGVALYARHYATKHPALGVKVGEMYPWVVPALLVDIAWLVSRIFA
jgi:hypothetical protein